MFKLIGKVNKIVNRLTDGKIVVCGSPNIIILMFVQAHFNSVLITVMILVIIIMILNIYAILSLLQKYPKRCDVI